MTYLQSKPIILAQQEVLPKAASPDALDVVRSTQRNCRTILVTFNSLKR